MTVDDHLVAFPSGQKVLIEARTSDRTGPSGAGREGEPLLVEVAKYVKAMRQAYGGWTSSLSLEAGTACPGLGTS